MLEDGFEIAGVTSEDLEQFENEGYSDEDALELAKGLLIEAVPCLSSIYNNLSTYHQKMAKYAVLEMAHYLKLEFSNFAQSTSPFQSETIGSYTYSRLAQSVRDKQGTGVHNFDRAVDTLSDLCVDANSGSGSAASTSEQVFKPGFENGNPTITSEPNWWSVGAHYTSFDRYPPHGKRYN